jgi:hypothetical protein
MILDTITRAFVLMMMLMGYVFAILGLLLFFGGIGIVILNAIGWTGYAVLYKEIPTGIAIVSVLGDMLLATLGMLLLQAQDLAEEI